MAVCTLAVQRGQSSLMAVNPSAADIDGPTAITELTPGVVAPAPPAEDYR